MTDTRPLAVPVLGVPSVPSPLRRGRGGPPARFAGPGDTVRCPSPGEAEADVFERAGPRDPVFFRPEEVRAAIVTCGGLCPGLNNVIRSLCVELHFNYRVAAVLGLRYGYRGLDPALAEPPVELTPERVDEIHEHGGTILGTSRGERDSGAMLDFLAANGINQLYCVGGDGTQRAAAELAAEAARRRARLAVVGVPKTIDNDIAFVEPSFGFATAIDRAREVLDGAHAEARSALNGVGLVKLMGRDAGFIACGATLASQEVNFTLVPEVPVVIEGAGGFLEHLESRLRARRHAVVVLAEGCRIGEEPDPGPVLKHAIERYAAGRGLPVSVKYFDPSYYVRSVPANSADSLLSDAFARHAAHAAMAGLTGVLVGRQFDRFILVPLERVAERVKRVDPSGELWGRVVSATGQPACWPAPGSAGS